jgi:uncharacterized protein YdaU (DUF1376 family)
MANEKLDWFPLYWQRFKIGTFEMKADEIGAYILLLIYEWDKGFLPTNRQELMKISKVSDKKLEKVLKKFEIIENKYFNETLEVIRLEQSEKHEKRSNRGKNGAKARWDKHKESIANGMLKQCLDDGNIEESRVEESRVDKNYINIGDEQIFEIEKWFEERFKLQKPNWQKVYPLANIDVCLNDFFLKRAFETFKDMDHFKKAFSIELQKMQDKNSNQVKNDTAKKSNTRTLASTNAEKF